MRDAAKLVALCIAFFLLVFTNIQIYYIIIFYHLSILSNENFTNNTVTNTSLFQSITNTSTNTLFQSGIMNTTTISKTSYDDRECVTFSTSIPFYLKKIILYSNHDENIFSNIELAYDANCNRIANTDNFLRSYFDETHEATKILIDTEEIKYLIKGNVDLICANTILFTYTKIYMIIEKYEETGCASDMQEIKLEYQLSDGNFMGFIPYPHDTSV